MTLLWFLHRPLQDDGTRCPDLHAQSAAQLTSTLLPVAVCQHPLAQAGAQYLLHDAQYLVHDGQRLAEGNALKSLLAPQGRSVHQVGGPTIAPCTIWTTGFQDVLSRVDTVYKAYDAAVKCDTARCRAVL